MRALKSAAQRSPARRAADLPSLLDFSSRGSRRQRQCAASPLRRCVPGGLVGGRRCQLHATACSCLGGLGLKQKKTCHRGGSAKGKGCGTAALCGAACTWGPRGAAWRSAAAHPPGAPQPCPRWPTAPRDRLAIFLLPACRGGAREEEGRGDLHLRHPWRVGAVPRRSAANKALRLSGGPPA